MAIAGYQNSATGKFYIEEFCFINNFQTSSERVLFSILLGSAGDRRAVLLTSNKHLVRFWPTCKCSQRIN